MNKVQDFNTFLQQTVMKKADEYYKRAMGHLIHNRQQVIDEYVAAFRDLCLGIKQKQRLNPATKVSYIQYSLLFSHVLFKKAPYRLEAFDEDYYLGNVISIADYNPTWLFEPLYEFYEEIQREARKYILRVTPIEVERVFLIELKKYEEIVRFLAKEAIETLVDTEEYQSLPYGEEVQFRIGEYRGTTDLLFIKNDRNDALWRYVCGLLSNQAG